MQEKVKEPGSEFKWVGTRPDRPDGAPPQVINGIPTLEDLETAPRVAGGQAHPRAHRLQRPDRRWRDQRRLPHPGRPPDAAVAAGARRGRRRGQPPRSTQGRARSEVFDGAGADPPRRARPGGRAPRQPPLRRRRGGQRRRLRPAARRGCRRVRQRRLRRVASRSTPRSSARRATSRRRWVACWRARSRSSSASATIRSARSWPCSGAPRSATSSG